MQSESIKDVRLTQTVQKGGCAAKVEAKELRKILSQVRFPPGDKHLLVDGRFFDDAAVYEIDENTAMVQTLDFFTPILDNAKLFGRVAAANALSDVYAMGGKPKTAMGILAFPLANLESSIIVEVMQGASDAIAEAGAFFVGGHSIDDDTLKFGLSVTGFVHPQKVWTNSGAKVGDLIILTKPLGTGTMTAALKRNQVAEQDIDEAIQSMAKLNNVVDDLDEKDLLDIHAATDITGFGLAGHAMQLAKASGVSLSIHFSKVPLFTKAMQFLQEGFLTKAHRTNASYCDESVDLLKLGEFERLMVFDPQTSGGLFLSVDKIRANEILLKIQTKFPQAKIIGEVLPKSDKDIYFAN